MSGKLSLLGHESVRTRYRPFTTQPCTRLFPLQLHIEVAALVREVVPLLINHVELLHDFARLRHLLHLDELEDARPVELLSEALTGRHLIHRISDHY